MDESILKISTVKISNGYHMLVSIRVDGKVARMILDTAASNTIFDKKRINKLIKNPVITNISIPATTAGSDVEQSSMQIKELKLNDTIINDYKAVVMDLSHINNAYKQHKHQPIDGVLGADILLDLKALIDLDSMELIF